MSDFTIIRNAPPPAPSRQTRPNRYPFAEMLIGDAFDVAITDKKQRYSVAAAAAAWANYRKNGWKFTTRLIDDNTVRIWRVA